MKYVLMLVLTIYRMGVSADELRAGPPVPSEVVHVATALDHLTVLEFGEPVTMAAAGSSAFQIERREDKVFVKPLKTGAATDLFVWTASRRFAYELEAPGEVKNMNFAVDSRISRPKPVPDSSAQIEEIADMMFSRAFVESERVDSRGIRDIKSRITIRIEHVLQSRNTVYVHYSVRNLTDKPYRIPTPVVAEVRPTKTSISLTSLSHTQLDQELVNKLGQVKQRAIPVTRAETGRKDVQPGEETQGVITIREQISSPFILELTFGSEGTRPVQATMVY